MLDSVPLCRFLSVVDAVSFIAPAPDQHVVAMSLQAYFCFYHAVSNILLRRFSNMFAHRSRAFRHTAMGLVVFTLSYVTAFMETLTISHFPYYTFVDRSKMYTIGSLFYAIYFFVSFPMFYRIDEHPKAKKWTISQICFDSLAAGMLVTLWLDTWRISFGGIVGSQGASGGLPWSAAVQ